MAKALDEAISVARQKEAEFRPDYDVPAVITKDLRLVDISWHNDLSPSFVLAGREDEDVQLWVGHPDPAIRKQEWGTPVPRFNVCDGEGNILVATEAQGRHRARPGGGCQSANLQIALRIGRWMLYVRLMTTMLRSSDGLLKASRFSLTASKIPDAP